LSNKILIKRFAPFVSTDKKLILLILKEDLAIIYFLLSSQSCAKGIMMSSRIHRLAVFTVFEKKKRGLLES